MKYDYLIVGAGLYGAVMAHELHKRGKKCLVIDKREHIAGNIYCEEIEGIHVHKYGAHIFHTSDKKIWDYINQFAEFNNYINSPIAIYQDELYNLPFNMNTFYQMWGVRTPDEAIAKVESQKSKVKSMLHGREPRNLEEQALLLVGKDIYEKLIKGYTEKQWGRSCTELPAFIIRRLPLRFVYDNNYFNDFYQGIPVGGYNLLVEQLLEGIDTRTNCDFFAHRSALTALADKIIYTGPIDRFYDFRFGKLEYRTVRFETEIKDTPNYQGNAVINYTDLETPFTRIIEHKHFESFGQAVYDNPKTVISREYSTEWQPGMEPYYPVNDNKNASLYAQYKVLADNESKVFFGGRLAEYKYYDMAPTIEQALCLADKELKE